MRRHRLLNHLLQAQHTVIEGRLRQRRLRHLPKVAQRQVGVILAQAAKRLERLGQSWAQPQIIEGLDKLELTLGRAGAARLVGELGVHASVHLVLHVLDRTSLFDLRDGARGPELREPGA